MKKNLEGNKSILNEKQEVSNFSGGEDGVDYINVSRFGATKLGRLLNPGHPVKFHSWLGVFNSVKTYMDFVNTPGYPKELVSKTNLKREDYANIPKQKQTVPNYWAIVAAGLHGRISGDKQLVKLLKDNELPFTSLFRKTNMMLFGSKVNVDSADPKMGRYLAIIRFYSDMIKNGDFFKIKKVEEFVEQCKDYPELDLLEGVPFEHDLGNYSKVKTDTEEVLETNEASDEMAINNPETTVAPENVELNIIR